MDITKYIEEYAQKKRFPNLSCKPEVVRDLLVGKGDKKNEKDKKSEKDSVPKFALVSQERYGESDFLSYNIEARMILIRAI